SPGLLFPCKIYGSSFNRYVPEQLRKMRIAGTFFNFYINPYTNEASYSFDLDEGVRLPFRELRDVLKLHEMLNAPNGTLYGELTVRETGRAAFSIQTKESKQSSSPLASLLRAAESAYQLAKFLGVEAEASTSLHELMLYRGSIIETCMIIEEPASSFGAKFSVNSDKITTEKPLALLFFQTTRLGTNVAGVLYALIGKAELEEDGKYLLLPERKEIVEKFVIVDGESIGKDDLLELMDSASERYEAAGLNPGKIIDEEQAIPPPQ